MDKTLYHFDCQFELKQAEEVEMDGGVKIGVFSGYASTFDNIDRQNDAMIRGCFKDCIKSMQDRNRMIRMYFQHKADNIMGGYPSEKAYEDEVGLFVEGHVNLDTQLGREKFALIKQGVLQDMSIGFVIKDEEWKNGVRLIKEVDLWEISVVTEPANPMAQVTNVKSAFHDLPIAEAGEVWEEADEEKAFIGDNVVAGLVDGTLSIIPKYLFSAAIKCKDRDQEAIEKHYRKINRESPFEKGFGPSELKTLLPKEMVEFLRTQPLLSKSGAKFFTEKLFNAGSETGGEDKADDLRYFKETLLNIQKGSSNG